MTYWQNKKWNINIFKNHFARNESPFAILLSSYALSKKFRNEKRKSRDNNLCDSIGTIFYFSEYVGEEAKDIVRFLCVN